MRIHILQTQPGDTRAVREVQARSWLATYPSPEHGITREWVENFVSGWSSPESLAEWETIIEHKKGVTDPDYCVHKFTAQTGRYYSNFSSEDFIIE